MKTQTEKPTADQLESAGRCLAAVLAQTDRKTAAALLRAAARYLEGPDEVGTSIPGLFRVVHGGGRHG